MKSRNLILKIAGLVLSLALGATFIWWRAEVSEKARMPWLDPKNHARIIAESRANGTLTAATSSDGTKYYFSASTKYMNPMRLEELRSLLFLHWRYNKDGDFHGQGTTYRPDPISYEIIDGKKVELHLTIDEVAPGTTAEELLEREGK